MTTAHPKSLSDIVDAARDMSPEEQARFVREACATDDALYQSAMQHLHSRQSWPGEPDDSEHDTQAPLPDLTGGRIGPYRIVRSLGQGGMGEVFLAERADQQFHQQVAIKLVRRGLLSRHVQGRLRLERQILATLDHPNIARLLDGGTMADGTPYIVMEYIDGEPIDAYCARCRLSVEGRLELFKVICSAVHRAHQNLVVHRDLKPSNILVTADGTPKLLDFGIAKLLDERQMLHTMAVTQADHRVMTPDHASPEQIQGEPITTASDIYVLGVLLYELLCGLKPFLLKGNRLGDLERAICEDDPAAPSAAVAAARSADRECAEKLAAERGTTPMKLQRRLRGDLDNIVSMAMRKEPQRRYSSVEQFATDIERHLGGMPVLARADSWGYRTGKFVRRHSVVVGLSVAMLALLIGFSVTTLMQSKRIERERDVAQIERAAAQAERERAEEVSGFLIDSFKLADPARARGKEITAREILDAGARRIASELQNQPVLQATLLDTIGNVYLNLGQYAEAQPLIERALTIRRELSGTDNLDVARSLYSLNRVHEEKGEWRQAEALARQSLAITSSLTGPHSLETARNLCQLGVIQHQKGATAEAKQLFEQCLSIRVTWLGRSHEQVTGPLDNLARLAQEERDFATAERLYREALQIDRRMRGEDHPQYVRHLTNLATVVHAKGDLNAAEPLYRSAIDLCTRILGAEHPETIDAMNNFGRFLADRGRLDDAQKVFEAVLTADRKIRPHHAYVGHDLAGLGRLAVRKGRHREAERYFRDALAVYADTLPPEHRYTAAAWTWLGRVLIELGSAGEAEAALARALAIWEKDYGKQSVWYATAMAARGKVWAMQGRSEDAERALTESYPIIAKSPQRSDLETARVVRGWIEALYAQQNRPEAAREYFAGIDSQQRR